MARYSLAGLCLFFASSAAPGVQATQKDSPDRLLIQAAALAQSGRLAEAEPLLESAAQLAPHDARIMTELGKVKGRLAETAEAVSCFQRALAEEPASADAHLNLALALADNGQLSDALREVDAVVKMEPRDGLAHYDRGRILSDLQRYDEAVSEFMTATQNSPDLTDAWFSWALLEIKEGNAPETSRLLQKVVALDPGNAHALVLLGKSLREQSRLPEALSAWRRALAVDPENSEGIYALALALRKSDPEESTRWMKRFEVLQQEKEKADKLNARVSTLGYQANVAMNAQDWSTATALLNQALEACGQCSLLGDLHKNLGLLDCHRGELDDAKRELTQAHALKPNDRDIVLALEWVAQQRSRHEM